MTGITDTTGIASTRKQLTQARLTLSDAREHFDLIKAKAEQRAIHALNGSAGKNDEERKRNLTIALATDSEYLRARQWVRDCERQVAEAETDLEIFSDQRRAEEWNVRLQLIIALDRNQISSDTPGDDVSHDDVLDNEGLETLQRQTFNTTDKAKAYADMDELF